jgi:DNA modification methylase
MCEWLIKTYSNEGDVVLDFTMGSGSTIVAAKNTGREFIGIEMDEEIFKIAEMRLAREAYFEAIEEYLLPP